MKDHSNFSVVVEFKVVLKLITLGSKFKKKCNEVTKCQTQFKFTHDSIIVKTIAIQITGICQFKINLIKSPDVNLPMNELK